VDREIVVSVSVRAVGYDRDASTLEIEFCDSSVFQYSEVPEEVYKGLMDSLGLNLEKTDLQRKVVRRPRLNLFKGVFDT
jgi:hypothetical protein